MDRNPVIGFCADIHGTGGHYILADGTKRLCGAIESEGLLRLVRAHHISVRWAWRDVGHAYRYAANAVCRWATWRLSCIGERFSKAVRGAKRK